MSGVLWVIIGAAAFLGYIVIHETGHAFAARVIGAPSGTVSIRLREWPAHVSLMADDQWHAPGTVEYQDAYARFDPTLRWLGAFVAAGFVFQTTLMVASVRDRRHKFSAGRKSCKTIRRVIQRVVP